MKYLFSILGIAVLSGLVYFNSPKEKVETSVKNEAFMLVQLFTSQGCSSCPKADELLEEVKKEYAEENVFLLSYHVDYWSRLGWKDPFSKKEYSNLQYEYANKLNFQTVYTPQVIINGKIGFVGSNRSKMEANLSKFLNTPSKNTIKISNTIKKDNKINFAFEISGKMNQKHIVAALVIDKKTTSVKRGENGGRMLSSSNIVVNEKQISLDIDNGKCSIEIPEIVDKGDKLGLMLFIQQDNLAITGANYILL